MRQKRGLQERRRELQERRRELEELEGRLACLTIRLHPDSELTAEAHADIDAELNDIRDRQREIREFLVSDDDGQGEEEEDL